MGYAGSAGSLITSSWTPGQSLTPVKISEPTPAATKPGTSSRPSCAEGNLPLAATTSNSSSAEVSGPPKTVLNAA